MAEETSWHVIMECPVLHNLRADIFQKRVLVTTPTSLKKLVDFIKKSPLPELLDTPADPEDSD